MNAFDSLGKAMLKAVREFLEFYPNADEAYWRNELKQNLSEAKNISDFINMLVQLSFFSVAIKYFYLKLFGADESLLSLCSFAVCLLIMSFLFAALLYKISSLVVGFFLQDSVNHQRKWIKYAILVFSFAQAALFMNGVTFLIDDLAGAHVLERIIDNRK